jgi:hypothetical protein
VVARSLFLASFSVFVFTSFLGIAAAEEVTRYSDMKASVATAGGARALALVSPVDDEGRGGATGGAVEIINRSADSDDNTKSGGNTQTTTNQPTTPTGPIPTIMVKVEPTQITAGESSKISWTSQNSKNCYIFDDRNLYITEGKINPQGFVLKNLTKTTEYKITCYGPYGSNAGSVVVNVKEVEKPTAKMTFTPPLVPYNGTAKLSWTSTGAKSCVVKRMDRGERVV